MYAKAGIKYSYAVHLRDTGTVRDLKETVVHSSLIRKIVRIRASTGMDSPRR